MNLSSRGADIQYVSHIDEQSSICNYNFIFHDTMLVQGNVTLVAISMFLVFAFQRNPIQTYIPGVVPSQ